MKMRINKVSKNLKNKTNLKKMMNKSLISISLKTITKTSKESGKYVNTTKKSKKTKNANLISKNKEIKSPIKSKILIINSLKLKNNSKSTKRKNYSKSTNYMSPYPSKPHKSNTLSILTTKINYKKTFQMQFCFKKLLLVDLVIEYKNLKDKKLISKKNKKILTKNYQS